MDPKIKEENLKRMYAEGIEMASKMIAFLKLKINQDSNFDKLERTEKKKILKEEAPQFKPFMQLHPIVAEYLICEKLFSPKAFKKYIKFTYGVEKSNEDKEFIAKDQKNIYYYKNKQYAIYYKFLLQESNNHLSLADINKLYNNMVNELNADTKKMLDNFERASNDFKLKDNELTDEKKREFIEMLMKKNAQLNSNVDT